MGQSYFSPSPLDLQSLGVNKLLEPDEVAHWIGKPTAREYMYGFAPINTYLPIPMAILLPALVAPSSKNFFTFLVGASGIVFILFIVAILTYLSLRRIARRADVVYVLTNRRVIMSYQNVAIMLGVAETGRVVGGRTIYSYEIPLLSGAEVRYTPSGIGNIDFRRTITIDGKIRRNCENVLASNSTAEKESEAQSLGPALQHIPPVFKRTLLPGPTSGSRRQRSSMIAVPQAKLVGELLSRLLEA